MKTVVIQIGNTDNKLTQKEWAFFIKSIQEIISDTMYVGLQIHFAGGASPEKAWQNYCFIFNCNFSDIGSIKFRVSEVGRRYKQDSVAITIGETELV